MRLRHTTVGAVLLVGAAALAGCGSSSPAGGSPAASSAPASSGAPASSSASKQPINLIGYFRITAGQCSSATAVPTGSYLAMLGAGGKGYVRNPTGGCANSDFSPLLPGTDKGLVTGAYQPGPTPAFDSKGNALAGRIFRAVTFFGTAFGGATAAVDAQTGVHVPPPTVTDTGGVLTADLKAFDVAYNNSFYNQGSPKPDGSYPGTTTQAKGTIACNGDFTLSWQSLIVGGAFNNFTGSWHLAGVFSPVSGSVASALGC